MGSLDSWGGDEDCEIVPMELPNPEKNKSVQLLLVFCNHLLDKQGLNAMVTVWLTLQKTPISYSVFDKAGRRLSKTAVNYVIPTRIVWQLYDFRIHHEIWKLNRQTVSWLPKLWISWSNPESWKVCNIVIVYCGNHDLSSTNLRNAP